jgi:hypothetical protein
MNSGCGYHARELQAFLEGNKNKLKLKTEQAASGAAELCYF